MLHLHVGRALFYQDGPLLGLVPVRCSIPTALRPMAGRSSSDDAPIGVNSELEGAWPDFSAWRFLLCQPVWYPCLGLHGSVGCGYA
jgi:hypothetical protein